MQRMAVPSESAAAPPWFEQVRREQIASLYRNILFGMSTTWVAGAVLAMVLAQQRAVAAATVIVWFGIITLLTVARVVLAIIYAQTPDAQARWRKWAAWFTAGATSSGLAWGIGSVFLMAPARLDLQMLVVVLNAALVYGALAVFARWLPAFFGFTLPAVIPSTLWSLAQGDIVHLGYGVFAVVWIVSLVWLGRRFHAREVQTLSLGFENAALAEDLRRQKDLADNANLAKSRFLAAASHDLRQPVHALGLFVGALKNEELAPQASHLVEQIDAATESLDELFTALLDVSRLDAGVVQPDIRPVALRPLIERLAGELAPAAHAKGLELRLRASDLWARSDSVMLERILRNLMTNALRYTERGGVLVAVRVSGAAASIEVWDTGPGIPESLLEKVFGEFYQGSDRRGEGGMGLGLAIVRRLCALLGHDVELRSRVGRGSMFRVKAPIARPPAVVAPREAMDAAVLPGARLWVVEDDAGARAGMQALLAAWGHDVRAAASGEEMLAAIGADARPPDAILCDYRLVGEDGVSVVNRLRARFDAQIPAALITGEARPDLLREALASGLPILHKPVSKARLRALIGNLTRASDRAFSE
jgi:signal transduction histidine kinase/CheY-like chemotaxis protein